MDFSKHKDILIAFYKFTQDETCIFDYLTRENAQGLLDILEDKIFIHETTYYGEKMLENDYESQIDNIKSFLHAEGLSEKYQSISQTYLNYLSKNNKEKLLGLIDKFPDNKFLIERIKKLTY